VSPMRVMAACIDQSRESSSSVRGPNVLPSK
jgi:hypothetical protein